MSQPIVFELCAETLEACLLAKAGGADRIELCSMLDVGGLTPSRELTEQAIHRSGLPVHVLLRPHADGFVYSASDFASILAELQYAQRVGAAGVVLGILNADRTVDRTHTRALVELAAPMEITFHRAFDEVPEVDPALEDVIATGCHRILTSGGAPDVLAGADILARLVTRAADRIQIAVGGGLRVSNAQEVRRRTGARHFHGSLRAKDDGPPLLAERIRTLIDVLHQADDPTVY
ncbi:MAG TPA: copper homeostasis protein CutC [Acidobacteriaceae bacterium]|nr:copper homeostasis protein CutC [Acidobacteriaceae bacterium]